MPLLAVYLDSIVPLCPMKNTRKSYAIQPHCTRNQWRTARSGYHTWPASCLALQASISKFICSSKRSYLVTLGLHPDNRILKSLDLRHHLSHLPAQQRRLGFVEYMIYKLVGLSELPTELQARTCVHTHDLTQSI